MKIFGNYFLILFLFFAGGIAANPKKLYSGHCRNFEWKCKNGECIRDDSVCNGHNDCFDKSDEDVESCKSWGDIVKNVTEDLSKACKIPELPNTKLFFGDNSKVLLKFDDIIDDSDPIYYKCDPGYKLFGKNYNNKCLNGTFIYEHPKCLKRCSLKLIESVSLQKTCYQGSLRVSCSQSLFEGATVKLGCQNGYFKPHTEENAPDVITCQENGEWSHTPYQCQAVCGTLSGYGETFTELRNSQYGVMNVPWNVGVYRLKKGLRNMSDQKYTGGVNPDYSNREISSSHSPRTSFELICGGSIINAKMMLSAASCFWDKKYSRPAPMSQFIAIVGKASRQYNSIESSAQQFRIKELYIPPSYQQPNTRYEDDIAIIIVDGIIGFSEKIKPICLNYKAYDDWNEKFLPLGTDGIVSGWSYNVDGEHTDELQIAHLDIVHASECNVNFPADFSSFIGTKYCVANHEGAAVCRIDAGSGYAVLRNDTHNPGMETYHLEAVVNIPVNTDEGVYSTGSYTHSSNVLLHIEAIKEFAVKNGVFFENRKERKHELCLKDEYKCGNGVCIQIEKLCNGINDCGDGLDEMNCCSLPKIEERFSNKTLDGGIQTTLSAAGINVTEQQRFDLSALNGAAVSLTEANTAEEKVAAIAQETTESERPFGSCSLKDVPLDLIIYSPSTWKILTQKDYVRNLAFIKYNCSSDGSELIGEKTNLCVDGKFSQDYPKCLKPEKEHHHCSPTAYENLKTVLPTCNTPNGDTCKGSIVEGSKVFLFCKDRYRKAKNAPWDSTGNPYYDIIKCEKSGAWSSTPFSCVPECGRLETPDSYPWHVAIHKNVADTEDSKRICGGTLISAKLVVSALYCFWDQKTDKIAESITNFKVVFNNNIASSTGIQEIIRPEKNKGGPFKQADFVILILENVIEFGELNVRPVCTTTHSEHWEKIPLEDHTIGMAGIRNVNEDSRSSSCSSTLTSNLRTEIVHPKFIDFPMCPKIQEGSKDNDYDACDKYCVASNGTKNFFCHGDIGSGIVVPVQEGDNTLYYLTGVVTSRLLTDKNGEPDECHTITNLTLYTEEIRHYEMKYILS